LADGTPALPFPTRTTYPDGSFQRIDWACCMVERVVDREGRATHFRHDGLKRLIEKEQPGGHFTRYGYDARDNLTRLEDNARESGVPSHEDVFVSAYAFSFVATRRRAGIPILPGFFALPTLGAGRTPATMADPYGPAIVAIRPSALRGAPGQQVTRWAYEPLTGRLATKTLMRPAGRTLRAELWFCPSRFRSVAK